MKRKQLLLLLALLMTAATGAWAQQTLTVYDGTGRQTASPANIVFIDEYTRSQTIIPSTALTAMKGCDITAMTFYSGTVISFTTECSFDVYLKEVSYSAFAESPTFEPKSSCTTVYQGTLSVVNGTLTLTVTFSKPFHYKGGNLLIGTENTSKNSYYPSIEFQGTHTDQGYTNISVHHSTDLASATSIAKSSFIPKTTFTYVVPTYSVKMKDGTQDAKNWTITSGENSATGDAADGLAGLKEGDAVTLKYGGRLKVKSVTATTDAAPAPAIEYNEASWDGTKVVLTKKTAASEPTAVADAQDGATWDKGWYTVSGNVTITGNVALTADTHLILQDGAQLTINGKLTCISDNSYNLYIYGQEAGDGKLNVSNSSYAFVGPNSSGKTIEIHGGEITATSTSATGFHSDGIKIYGGKLTATSEAWAGIGFNSGNFDVYGGEVEAKSNGTYGILGNVGTPILTVYGGKVQATGGAGSDLKAIHAKIKSGTSGIKFYFTNTEGVWGDGVTYSTETDAPTKRYAKAE